MSPTLQHTTPLARQLGTMVLSRVTVAQPMSRMRAASWCNSMARLGIHLPFFVVHDLGVLFTTVSGPGGYRIQPNPTLHVQDISLFDRVPSSDLIPQGRLAHATSITKYDELLVHISESDVVKKLACWRLRDDLVSVILTRILSDVYQRWREPGKGGGGVEALPLEPSLYGDPSDDVALFKAFDRQYLWRFLDHLVSLELHIYTCTELIDLDTVRLLGLFREDSASGSESIGASLEMVDLVSALSSVEANDVANFSLDLLPSVLETKRSSGAQTFSVDGYASIERKGHIDSLMLSELAHDEQWFEQKVVNQELLYFGHEREREDERRLQYILVDSSASMRGKRQVFARGLALTLVKKLGLLGDDIWFRFFDSRLHEVIKVSKGGAFPVPYVLSFRSDNGRNYGKVMRQLLLEMARLRREDKRNITVYLITHGQCHIAPELIAALAEHASLYGIIILPSSELTLEFLPLLDRQQIVGDETFVSRADRKDRALNIVDDVSALGETR